MGVTPLRHYNLFTSALSTSSEATEQQESTPPITKSASILSLVSDDEENDIKMGLSDYVQHYNMHNPAEEFISQREQPQQSPSLPNTPRSPKRNKNNKMRNERDPFLNEEFTCLALAAFFLLATYFFTILLTTTPTPQASVHECPSMVLNGELHCPSKELVSISQIRGKSAELVALSRERGGRMKRRVENVGWMVGGMLVGVGSLWWVLSVFGL
ncbi:hypothetical protein B0J14DRAFT_591029 [Halenospora varia]|nr:hypothetical protein B0J14DRAFT_591029 [Halenospora varia]